MPARATSPEPTRKSYVGKKGRTSNAKDVSPELEVEKSDQEMADEGGENEEDEEQEEEYEIEAILGDDVGTFPDGRTGYFVKWKGYPSSQNSWVDEQDAVNARNLIDAYWRMKRVENKKTRAKEGRKSLPKAKTKQLKRQQPTESEDGQDGEEEGEAPVKKTRKSITGSTPPKKPAKSKKNETKVGKNLVEVDEMEVDDDVVIDMFEKYKHLKSWEKMVESVETVERTEDDELMVYFKTVAGERATQTSTICKDKFPQKLLDFYESNLRWKHQDNEAD